MNDLMKNYIGTRKPCGHKWECGCDKTLCENCERPDYDKAFCQDETCPSYYLCRNDRCDCGSLECGFCKTNPYIHPPTITCPVCQSQEPENVVYLGEGTWRIYCYTCATRQQPTERRTITCPFCYSRETNIRFMSIRRFKLDCYGCYGHFPPREYLSPLN